MRNKNKKHGYERNENKIVQYYMNNEFGYEYIIVDIFHFLIRIYFADIWSLMRV
jgi:hypothetical protein